MDNSDFSTPPHRQPLREKKERDKYFKLRNILNIIFMVGAIVGCLIFYYSDHLTGSIVIMGAMAFKFIECALRIFNR
jgi:hypothetical protein